MSARAKQPVSFRFSPSTIAHLKRRSEDAGAPQGALAERYIEEGMRMDEHPLVYFRDAGSGRRPAIVGTRLDVAQIIETLRQNDNSLEETADYLDLAVPQVEAALRYYAAYRHEVDDWIARGREVADRERELWRRQQDALSG